MHIVPGTSTFQLNRGDTLGSCAQEIAAKMLGKEVKDLKPGEWMPILQDLVKKHGFDSIHDPRLSKLASTEDKEPATFELPSDAVSFYKEGGVNPSSALGEVVQPGATGADTVRRAGFFGNDPVAEIAAAGGQEKALQLDALDMVELSEEARELATSTLDLEAFQNDAGGYVQGRVDAAFAEIDALGGPERALQLHALGMETLSPDAERLAELNLADSLPSEGDLLPEDILYQEIESNLDARLDAWHGQEEGAQAEPAGIDPEAGSDPQADLDEIEDLDSDSLANPDVVSDTGDEPAVSDPLDDSGTDHADDGGADLPVASDDVILPSE